MYSDSDFKKYCYSVLKYVSKLASEGEHTSFNFHLVFPGRCGWFDPADVYCQRPLLTLPLTEPHNPPGLTTVQIS